MEDQQASQRYRTYRGAAAAAWLAGAIAFPAWVLIALGSVGLGLMMTIYLPVLVVILGLVASLYWGRGLVAPVLGVAAAASVTYLMLYEMTHRFGWGLSAWLVLVPGLVLIGSNLAAAIAASQVAIPAIRAQARALSERESWGGRVGLVFGCGVMVGAWDIDPDIVPADLLILVPVSWFVIGAASALLMAAYAFEVIGEWLVDWLSALRSFVVTASVSMLFYFAFFGLYRWAGG